MLCFYVFEGEDYFSCGLYLVFLGLSFRAVSSALRPFVLRSHVAVWKRAQKAIHL